MFAFVTFSSSKRYFSYELAAPNVFSFSNFFESHCNQIEKQNCEALRKCCNFLFFLKIATPWYFPNCASSTLLMMSSELSQINIVQCLLQCNDRNFVSSKQPFKIFIFIFSSPTFCHDLLAMLEDKNNTKLHVLFNLIKPFVLGK